MPIKIKYSLLLVLLKLSKVAKSLFVLAKSAKIIAPFLTVFTMMLSTWAYSAWMGWVMAGLIVLLIFIHEMGHVWACYRKGMGVRLPIFIPFLGAAIFAPANMTREEESYVGYGGPFIGTIGALAVWLLWFLLPSHPTILLMVSYTGCLLNLFNLIPIRPLDGGRILQSLGAWVQWVGLGALIVLTVFMKDPGMMLIWLMVLMDFDFKFSKWMALVAYAGMMGLMFLGYGNETWWSMAICAVLGLLFAALLFLRKPKESSGASQDVRPPQTRDRVVFWSVSYMVLAIVLVASMYFQSLQMIVP